MNKAINKEILDDLYNKQGKSQAEIAKVLNVSKSRVSDWCIKFNINTRYKRHQKQLCNCKICHKEFYRHVSQIKNNKDNVCSRECVAKLRSINNSGIKNGRYNGKAAQKTFVCDYCNNSFSRYIHPIQKNNEKNFCSTTCMGKWNSGPNHYFWAGGNDKYYGENWDKQRKKTQKKYGRCLICSKEREDNGNDLSVHHYILFRLFKIENSHKANFCGDYDTNLGLYCMGCHAKVEKFTRLFWTQEFFDSAKILQTYPTIKEENSTFHCYSFYK